MSVDEKEVKGRVDDFLDQVPSGGVPELVRFNDIVSELEEEEGIPGSEVYGMLTNGYTEEADVERTDLEVVSRAGELYFLQTGVEQYPEGVLPVEQVERKLIKWFSENEDGEEVPRSEAVVSEIYERHYSGSSEHRFIGESDVEACLEYLEGELLGVLDQPAPPKGGKGYYLREDYFE